jgi:hypothetical protein
MAMAPFRRLRRRLASEEGSFLIEALVTAAILLTVSAGVVLALQTAHAQSGLQRAKAIATDVAQTKLDELRSRAYNSLRPLNETDTLDRGGIRFTVVSTASTVAQTGAPSGCNNQRARDYMSLKTTVTWPRMGQRKPVVLDTLVAAPVGAGGGLIVNVTGGAGQGVPGIPLLLSSGAGSATTDAGGCARWDAVSAGTGYSLTTSVNEYVQPNGEQDVAITGINIVAEETAQESFAYDRGGSASINFRQRNSTNTLVDVASTALPKDVVLSNASTTVTKPVAAVSGAIGRAGLFFPYPSSAYAAYADKCTAAMPPSNTASIVVTAGAESPTVDLVLPSLNVKATNNSGATLSTDYLRIRTDCGTIYERPLRVSDGLLADPGLPYGTNFTVCAVSPSTNRRGMSTGVSNASYAAPGTSPTTINMTSSGSCNI